MATMELIIETRSSMGWPYTPNAERAACDTGMVAHYNGGPTGLSVDKPHSKCREYWDWCRDFHINGNGWNDVGYCWFMCPHGIALQGRATEDSLYVQAAQPGGNSTWMSCTFGIGGDEVPSDEAILGWQLLRDHCEHRYGVGDPVLPHSAFIPTDCPGAEIDDLIENGTLAQEPTEIEKDDVMQTVVHLASKEQQVILGGERKSIGWHIEHADPEGIHKELGQPSIFPINDKSTPHLMTVELDIATPLGGDPRKVRVAFSKYERSADEHVDDLREQDIGDMRHVTVSGTVTVSKDSKYRVDIINDNPDTDVIVSRAFWYVTR